MIPARCPVTPCRCYWSRGRFRRCQLHQRPGPERAPLWRRLLRALAQVLTASAAVFAWWLFCTLFLLAGPP